MRAEESLIGAVFANLIGNALKYGPRAGATISVEAKREPGAHRFIVTGGGRVIPYEDRERIFEPYERGRAERRTRGGGLGLAICRQIVQWHGGEIGVEETDGPSICVLVHAPRSDLADRARSPTSASTSTPSTTR